MVMIRGRTRLVVDRQETSQGCGSMISTTRWLYKYSVLNADWTVHQEYHHDYLNEVGCWILVVPRLTSVACAPSSAPEGIRLLTGLSYDPLNSCTLYGHMRDETIRNGSRACPTASTQAPPHSISMPTGQCRGFCRRPTTSVGDTGSQNRAVTDTIPTCPPKTPHRPLFQAATGHVLFRDSGLYIWDSLPGRRRGYIPAPVRATDHQRPPQPVQRSVTLTWSENASADRLDILNILGQQCAATISRLVRTPVPSPGWEDQLNNAVRRASISPALCLNNNRPWPRSSC